MSPRNKQVKTKTLLVPYLTTSLNNVKIPAYLDTGATISLISDTVLPIQIQNLKKYAGKVVDANGQSIPIIGEDIARIITPDGSFNTRVLVFKKNALINHDLLLGMNALRYSVLDFPRKRATFSLNDRIKVGNSPNNLQLKIDDLTIKGQAALEKVPATRLLPAPETGGTASGTVAPSALGNVTVGKGRKVRAGASSTPNITNRVSKEFDVHVCRDIVIPNNSITTLSVPVNKKIPNGTSLLLLRSQITPMVESGNLITKVKNNRINIELINIGDEQVTLKTGTKFCRAEYFNPESVTNVPSEQICTANEANADSRPLTSEDINCADPEMKLRLRELFNKYRDVCWLPGDTLGRYRGDQLEIITKNNKVVNKAPYRIPYAFQEELDTVIKKMLAEKTIKRSKSSYNSPLIIVKRPDGDIRPCIDYRELNAVLEPISFPLPRISDLLNSLGKSTYISTMDLASAYHQCEIRPEDREKTAFTVKNTKYEFLRVPFGLQSAPGFFARVINEVLYDVLGPQCLAYMDDIVIFSKSAEEHLKTIEDVLQKLLAAGIKLKIRKCQFFAKEIKFLGYQITKDGMTMNNERVAAIKAMPLPQTKKQVQAFLGMCNYFRIFVAKFAEIAEPLYALLRKNVRFEWTHEQTTAVNTLKDKLSNAPIVKFPDYERPFHLHSDASNVGISACLMQEYDGLLHPIAYVSKTLNTAQQNYSTTKKEALALTYALEQFRHIILMFEVHVYTDHKPLLGALQKPTKDECLTRWSLLVQEYAIKLHYLEGKKNIFADTLSRLPDINNNSKNLTEQLSNKLIERNEIIKVLNEYIPVKMPWTEQKLRSAQRKDPACIKLIKQLNNNGNNNNETDVPPHVLVNCRIIKGIVYMLRVIKRSSLTDEFLVPYIPDELMPTALKLMHNESTAGHQSVERMLKLFRKNFYNNKEMDQVAKHCAECELCIRAKGLPKTIPISKYPIPIRPFDTISSDILGPLRVTENGNTYVLTVRDFTTRYTVLFPLKRKTSEEIIFALRSVISHYGASNVLITDNAAEYRSEKLSNFLRFFNTRKVETAPYHPASQGLAERINREINKLLRIYLKQYAINDWDLLLPVLQLTINSTYNSSIRETPFYALFGYDSSSVALSPPKMSYAEDELTQHMQRVAKVRQHCRNNLLHVQAAYTEQANAGRKTKDISIGQRVYAKADKHKQQPTKKLDLPIHGPFHVIDKKGKAWKLKELETGKIFVVHPDYIIPSPSSSHLIPPPIKHEENDESGTEDNLSPVDSLPLQLPDPHL